VHVGGGATIDALRAGDALLGVETDEGMFAFRGNKLMLFTDRVKGA
jgi:hypothetical protein